jgi:hypothetical protein
MISRSNERANIFCHFIHIIYVRISTQCASKPIDAHLTFSLHAVLDLELSLRWRGRAAHTCGRRLGRKGEAEPRSPAPSRERGGCRPTGCAEGSALRSVHPAPRPPRPDRGSTPPCSGALRHGDISDLYIAENKNQYHAMIT